MVSDMSATINPTVAATPDTTETAAQLLASMAALSGIATDYNQGSQIRTQAEAVGAVVETQGVGAQALVLQAMVYGALALFGIPIPAGVAATGTVAFSTALPVSAAFPVPQAVPIPAGTLVQAAGTIYSTVAGVVLVSGASSVNVGIVCTVTGSVGNAPSGAISASPLTGIGYPLFVSNAAPIAGGADAGNVSTAIASFTARVASLGLASPVAIANAIVGVASGTETVRFGAVYEPWLAAGSGAGSGVAGFTVLVDNGSGSASSGLLAAVAAFITGSVSANQSGFRPAGVPFTVSGTTPLYATVTASGTIIPGVIPASTVTAAATSGILAYFASLGIGASGITSAQQPQVAGAVADAGLGLFQSLSVNLFYSGSATPVPAVTGSFFNRVILQSATVNISAGT